MPARVAVASRYGHHDDPPAMTRSPSPTVWAESYLALIILVPSDTIRRVSGTRVLGAKRSNPPIELAPPPVPSTTRGPVLLCPEAGTRIAKMGSLVFIRRLKRGRWSIIIERHTDHANTGSCTGRRPWDEPDVAYGDPAPAFIEAFKVNSGDD